MTKKRKSKIQSPHQESRRGVIRKGFRPTGAVPESEEIKKKRLKKIFDFPGPKI